MVNLVAPLRTVFVSSETDGIQDFLGRVIILIEG